MSMHHTPPHPGWWHPDFGAPRPVPVAEHDASEELAMEVEFPAEAAAALVQAWSDVTCWLTWNGEAVLGAKVPDSALRRHLAPVAPRLRALQREVRRPASADGAESRRGAVAPDCAAVAGWAEGVGAPGTALAFAQLAARAAPGDPAHAYLVGRLARKNGNHQASWEWLRWAAWRARVRGDRATLTRALAGLGAMYEADGQLFGAMRYWRLALAHARADGPAELVPEALGALAGIDLERGALLRGLGHAGRVLDALSPHDARARDLARAVAHHLTSTYALHEPAFLLFDLLLQHAGAPVNRLLLHGGRAHAAAGAGRHGAYEESWSAVVGLARFARDDREAFGAALVQLARAAVLLRQWRRAGYAAALAREITAAGPHDDASLLADALLAGARREARLREAFPVLFAPGGAAGEAGRFYHRVVEVLGGMGRSERAGRCVGTARRIGTGRAVLPEG